MAPAESPLVSASLTMAEGINFSVQKIPNNPRTVSDSSRRHSLPTQFLPSSLTNNHAANSPLTVESEEAARGEHTVDEVAIAHRLSALRQLNGGRTTRHRYAKSTGARSSTFSQPVIVRTYSGATRPRSQQRDPLGVRKENMMTKSKGKANAKLPPIEAFTFKGIMDEIKHDVSEDLERIAEICARSKYSLSNQYEVHMPPHGRGEPTLHRIVPGPPSAGVGPTLQAIESDDDQPRIQARGSRGSRRTRSAAYGTLETIMSSSRSSEEDQSKKKPAAEIAEEVRGRVARKNAAASQSTSQSVTTRPDVLRIRSKSITFASAFLENATTSKQGDTLVAISTLVSEPARPRTSAGVEDLSDAVGKAPSQFIPQPQSARLTASQIQAKTVLPTITGNISAWLPWKKHTNNSTSNAEGSLKNLLQASGGDRDR